MKFHVVSLAAIMILATIPAHSNQTMLMQKTVECHDTENLKNVLKDGQSVFQGIGRSGNYFVEILVNEIDGTPRYIIVLHRGDGISCILDRGSSYEVMHPFFGEET